MTGSGMNIKRLLSVLGMTLILAGTAVYQMPSGPAAAQEPYIEIVPRQGVTGTKVIVSGVSFTPSVAGNATVNATITFAKTYFPDKDTLVKNTAIDWLGNMETEFTIGEYPAGRQKVWVFDGSASPPRWSSAVFTIEPQMKLSVSSGFAGDDITVSGTGFAAASGVTVYFNDKQLTVLTTTAKGSFSKSGIVIPPSQKGSHTIKVVDANNNLSTGVFTIQQKMTISPSSGPVGRKVIFTGTSFAADKLISVTINKKPISTSPSFMITSPTGNFTGQFYMPAYAVGAYNITISDGANEAAAVIEVTFGGQLNRIVGYVTSEVTYTGSGFIPGRVATLHFDGAPLAEATVSPAGNLAAVFTIPASSGGDHIIFVTDGTSNTTHTFTVFSVASSQINRDRGYVGADIIFSGARFVPGKILTVYYDSLPITEATVDSNGNFSAGFRIPPGPGGAHSISTTDGINTANITFTMESIPPPAPLLLLPANDSELEDETAFLWEDVRDPSGVTYTFQIAADAAFSTSNISSPIIDKSGLSFTEYTIYPEALPGVTPEVTKEGVTYYWRVRATDNALNTGEWSDVGTFRIPAEGPSWFLLSVIAEGGIFALLFGFWMVRKRRN